LFIAVYSCPSESRAISQRLSKSSLSSIPKIFIFSLFSFPYASRYVTKSSEARTRYFVRFVDWKKVKRDFPAGDSYSLAKRYRDKVIGQNQMGHDFDKLHQPGLTFFPWSERFLQVKAHKKSHDKDVRSSNRLKDFFGNCRLEEITTSKVEEFKQFRLQEKTRRGNLTNPATINRELACLRSMLRLACDDGLLDKIPRIRMLPENERDRKCSPEEFDGIYEKLPEHIRLPITFLSQTGMRVSELLGIRWNQVDLKRDLLILEFGMTKGKAARQIPLSRSMRAVFDQLRKQKVRSMNDAVFTHKGKPITRYEVSEKFRKARNSLGIKDLCVHDLRRTFATSKLDERWDREWIKMITGHKTDYAFRHYNKPSIEQLRKVVEGVSHRSETAERARNKKR